MATPFEPVQTNLTWDQARALFDAHIKDEKVRMHCRASEVIMRRLANHFGQDEEQWAILGLLHDIDFDKTKDNVQEHCILSRTILAQAGVSQEAIDIVCSHAWGTECGGEESRDRKRTRGIEHALVAAETITGLIYAAALMNPEKSLTQVNVQSLKKKFKSNAFARNCNRDFMAEIEKTGLALNDFFAIAIQAMQEISDELGL
jgi:putative nucleotidyltransferase with HDIG domain